jgi:hypothetical protein
MRIFHEKLFMCSLGGKMRKKLFIVLAELMAGVLERKICRKA